MSVQLTQFVATDDGECTMTDSIEVGAAIKLEDGTHAVSFSGDGFMWGVVKSKGAALPDDAVVAEAGVWPVETAQDEAERWLRIEPLAKEAKAGKQSRK